MTAAARREQDKQKYNAMRELTPLGHDLAPVMSAIKVWAETHLDDVLAARSRRDSEV